MSSRQFLKITLRNIRFNKYYYIINVSGLAIGMACALLLFAYVLNEFLFDRYHNDHDNIYRISCTTVIDGKQTDFANMPPAFGPAIENYIPEIADLSRLSLPFPINNGLSNITYEDKQFYQNSVFMVDSTVFNIFSYTFLAGDKTALHTPGAVVLTDKLAKKMFGPDYLSQSDLLDRALEIDGHEFSILGVIQDPPFFSHIQPSALLSWTELGDDNVWDDSQAYTYVRLQNNASLTTLNEKLAAFVDHNPNIQEVAKRIGAVVKLTAEPIQNIHLYSHKEYETSNSMQWVYIYSFIINSIFFIASTCINYLNLTLAISSRRFNEVGIRKILGASRSEVQKHFFFESMVATCLAAIIALGLFYLLLPAFNDLLNYKLDVSILLNPKFIGIAVLVITLVILISGGYPAAYMSIVNPIQVVKNKSTGKPKKNRLRRALLVIQFSISAIMITAILAASNQINFINNKDLGFNKENTLLIKIPDIVDASIHARFLKDELSKNPNIVAVAMSDFMPGISSMIDEHRIERANGEMKPATVARLFVDESFTQLLSFDLIKGRAFQNSPNDMQHSFIVNEAAVKEFGWDKAPAGPIGMTTDGFNYNKKGEVIGVVKDVNLFSLKEKIKPLILSLSNTAFFVYVRFDHPIAAVDIDKIKSSYEQVFDKPFEYSLLNQLYDQLYDPETRMNKTLFAVTTILLVISAIGLFSLSMFVISQQTKEIGIRKILGANQSGLIQMLGKGYFWQILLANAISVPISYILLSKWLEGYAYKAPLQWWLFPIPLLATIVIAFISISYTIISVSKINPAQVLKYE